MPPSKSIFITLIIKWDLLGFTLKIWLGITVSNSDLGFPDAIWEFFTYDFTLPILRC